MEINNRKSISDTLKKYCFSAKDDDFIEIVEWINGEGFDVTISNNTSDKIFSLSYDELDAIKYLTMTLNYNEKL